MLLTPAQNEQWKKTINLLDYLDSHAMTPDGLVDYEKRLKILSAPRWVAQLRIQCVGMGWEEYETWVPEFALRSEVALAGLQIVHPGMQEADVYRRVFLRLLHLAIKPMLDEQCQPLVRVYRYCENVNSIPENSQWHLDDFPDDKSSLSAQDRSADQLRAADMYYLASACMGVCRFVLFQPAYIWWRDENLEGWGNLYWFLNKAYQWHRDGWTSEFGPDYIKPIADAYLTALEAECPPPDWLPQI